MRQAGDGELGELRRHALLTESQVEMKLLRARLRKLTREYEKSNEELRSMNEELRSTLEELERGREKLRNSERRYRALVEASTQMVWTMESGGRLVIDSPSWRDFTGQSYAEWRGLGWLSAVHPADKASIGSSTATPIKSNSVIDTEFRLRHHSGEWRWIHMRAVPFFDEADGRYSWVGMNIDITERKQAEEVAEELASQLTLAEHKERDRIAQILHDDLQQQLYGLRLRLDYLATRLKDKGLLSEVATMEEDLELAVQTTRDLSMELSPPIIHDQGIAGSIRWLGSQMRERYGLVVRLVAEEPLPVPDRDRLILIFQVIRELLFNAVKHGRTRHVAVIVQYGDGVYRIDVLDKGVGFDPAAVFSSAASVSGRGLFYMREQLRIIGGQLEVDSAPGDGTRITVVVPPTAQ